MEQHVSILYTNWKGETRTRRIKPQSIYWGSTEYHTEPQWLLDALDCEKQEFRQFAMKDIREWTPVG